MQTRARRLGIVGAGFTGTMLAVHLIRLSRSPLRIFLFDRAAVFGKGTAYSTPNAKHLLNVRVANMSAFEADPEHFVRWLEKDKQGKRDPHARTAFASRGTYGRYLSDTLHVAQQEGGGQSTVSTIGTEVTGVRVTSKSVTLETASGECFDVDHAVLCVGNFPPALPVPASVLPLKLDRYVENPWSGEALHGISSGDPVVLIGTGLTMVDVVLELRSRGHAGPLTAVSRRGLLPTAHETVDPYGPFLAPDALPGTVLELVRKVRQEVRKAAARNVDWRSVIDALRPQTAAQWRNLPLDERRRFLRHVRPYWEVHRHRMAPSVAAEIAALRGAGQLVVVAGRIMRVVSQDRSLSIGVRRRADGGLEHLEGAWLVNCSGPQLDYERMQDPLVRFLMDSGLARPDPLQLGLDVDDDFRLLGRNGIAAANLSALGPPIRGNLWETTAVPDIRKQCEKLACNLLSFARRHP